VAISGIYSCYGKQGIKYAWPTLIKFIPTGVNLSKYFKNILSQI